MSALQSALIWSVRLPWLACVLSIIFNSLWATVLFLYSVPVVLFSMCLNHVCAVLADSGLVAALPLLLVYVQMGASRTCTHPADGRRGVAVQCFWPSHVERSRLCHDAEEDNST